MLAMDLRRRRHESEEEQIARLIDWHTPELPPAYSPRHCASQVAKTSDRPTRDPAADGAQPHARLVRAFTLTCQVGS
jgi:hypothetical protein